MKSILNYIGGKWLLSKRIVSMIPEHTCYVEPFCGAAWVFFRKEPSRVEVLNDLDGELVNLFRVIQHHPREFLRQFELLLVSREQFQAFRAQDPSLLTDVQRAARWFYLQKLSFGGNVKKRHYGYGTDRPDRLNLATLRERIFAAWRRLLRVNIENLPWEECVRRYDREHTFFYIDPPYWGQRDYRFNLEEQDYRDMAALLSGIRGKFLLSLNDRPEVRELFGGGFKVEPVEVRYTCARHSRGKYPELLIRNY